MGPKKKDEIKMSLGEFLVDKTMGSWADEMEDTPVYSRTGYGTERRTYGNNAGSHANVNAAGYSYREEPILPDKPPFTVHLGNLSFDATTGDVSDFFMKCECTNVRIIEDRIDMKPKGFGYAEFATRDGLKQALTLNGSQFQGRSIRINIADPPKDRGDRPEARDISDWSRKGPLPDLPSRSGMGSGRRDQDRGFGPDSGGDRKDRYQEGDGKIRDLGNWERKGPLSPIIQPERSHRDGGRSRTNDAPKGDSGFRDRRSSPAAWGEGRLNSSYEGSRPPRRDVIDRPTIERTLTAAEQDNQWRSKMRPDPPAAKSPVVSRDGSEASSSPARNSAVSLTRPKLNLAKRTVSEVHEKTTSSETIDVKASPFGAAKPIDTAAKEREIEEKRLATIREKKEAEERALEEKKQEIKAAAEIEEKKVVEILQRTDNSSLENVTDSVDKVSLNDNVDDNKPVDMKETTQKIRTKPSEAVAWRSASNGPLSLRDDIPKGPRAGRGGFGRGRDDGREGRYGREGRDDREGRDGREGREGRDDPRFSNDRQYQQKTNGVSTPPIANARSQIESEPKEIEEDGWRTVSKHKKNGRAGNQAARAIVS
ncbi:translation initiation factor 4B [Erysiphe neolycopersici]|uniref:Translation initiation factor 4B n=1 Tax=Erysiphe neolycopersici TaxID=212602 RepID=A0A420HN81_9PEZI|nr:translation initiation factor 4B [Erysiphe neolycopersici]